LEIEDAAEILDSFGPNEKKEMILHNPENGKHSKLEGLTFFGIMTLIFHPKVSLKAKQIGEELKRSIAYELLPELLAVKKLS
jgi:hypothetical protein